MNAKIEKEVSSFVTEKDVLKSALEEIEKGALDLCSVSKEKLTNVIVPWLIEDLNRSDDLYKLQYNLRKVCCLWKNFMLEQEQWLCNQKGYVEQLAAICNVDMWRVKATLH